MFRWWERGARPGYDNIRIVADYLKAVGSLTHILRDLSVIHEGGATKLDPVADLA